MVRTEHIFIYLLVVALLFSVALPLFGITDASGSPFLTNTHLSLQTSKADKPGERSATEGSGLSAKALAEANNLTFVMVELADMPIVVFQAQNRLKLISAPQLERAVQVQQTKIEATQQSLLPELSKPEIGAKVIYRVQKLYNGLALQLDAKNIEKLSHLPGVKAVHPLPLHYRANASSVPLIGAPTAWTSYGITGTNIKIGIIDGGIDYLHADFGGPATPQAYITNSTTLSTSTYFPTAKVVGGVDLAGDSYNGSNDPVPDPNPMECSGSSHGTHVAATAAGLGVNSDGTTYTGSYNNVPTTTMRIGPGVAPGAKLYAIRVFGCTGETNLDLQGLEWAVDPNHDGIPDDHLDVVNLSLGTNFVLPGDPLSVASDTAALAGMVVVAAAGNGEGNGGDLYYANGSPANAIRAISVAASVQGTSVTDGFRVN
ncbi:MAG: S8 family serine peptidase, partial [Chloroflexota bacterium]